jgi:hypothetical protein
MFTFRGGLAALVHALATLIIAAFCAVRGGNMERVVSAGAYIAGAEVLWRMTRVTLFYEFGKYALILVFAIALIRMRSPRWHVPALIGFSLLLPSTVLTISGLDLDLARKHISFNLSGPLALAICICFLQNVRLTKEQLCRVFVVYMGPVIGIMTLALLRLNAWSAFVRFSNDSNAMTSGGGGPNQVSAALGLGALLGILCLLLLRIKGGMFLLLLAVTLGLATQSALTFSRGGVYSAMASGTLAALSLINDSRILKRVALIGGITVILAVGVVIPRLDEFTGGVFMQRFESLDVTNRDTLIRDELKIWQNNLLFGVGPGMAGFNRSLIETRAPAHTEFSRLLAEHGMFGAVVIVILASIMLNTVMRAKSREERALRIALTSWTVLFMIINGMRLAAPSLICGLALVSMASGPPESLLRARRKLQQRVSAQFTPRVAT